MKSMTINSSPFSDFLGGSGIRVPESIKREIEKRGIMANPMFAQPSFISELQAVKREPMRERELSVEEILNLFERRDTLKIVYVPHFMTQCVVYYLDRLLDYAREHRLSDYKKHCRLLKVIKADYIAALNHEMPPSYFKKFLSQRDEYLALCGANLSFMFFTFNNEILKRHGKIEHVAFYSYAHIILTLIAYVENFDKKANKMIADKVGSPCCNQGDARLTGIKKICNDIIRHYPLQSNTNTEQCIAVMANKAIIMINEMD